MDDRLKRILEVVNEQAEDPALWIISTTAPEAYIQHALRRLHAAIEAEDWAVELFKTVRHDG